MREMGNTFKSLIFKFNGKSRWGGREVRGETILISRPSPENKSSNY